VVSHSLYCLEKVRFAKTVALQSFNLGLTTRTNLGFKSFLAMRSPTMPCPECVRGRRCTENPTGKGSPSMGWYVRIRGERDVRQYGRPTEKRDVLMKQPDGALMVFILIRCSRPDGGRNVIFDRLHVLCHDTGMQTWQLLVLSHVYRGEQARTERN
jgi:hypothetical protein